jgi:hypothetical protein
MKRGGSALLKPKKQWNDPRAVMERSRDWSRQDDDSRDQLSPTHHLTHLQTQSDSQAIITLPSHTLLGVLSNCPIYGLIMTTSNGPGREDLVQEVGHSPDGPLDPHLHLESDSAARYSPHTHAIDTESHNSYPQMDNDDHEHNHDMFFDGSAMIHAAFAAQAIELAEKERQEAERDHQPQVESIQNIGEEGLPYDAYSYESTGQTKARTIGSLPLGQEDSQRPIKRRKTTSVRAKKTKSKGTSADERTGHNLALIGDESPGHDVRSIDDAAAVQLEALPHDIAPKRQPPADIATKKRSHITAEQKRRAAIKSGYEALYRVIPALRDADLKEGKGRGGSGPGGGGSRTIRNGEQHGQTPTSAIEPRTTSSRRGFQSTGGSASPRGLGNDNGRDNRSYPHYQQYDEQGRPIRPGVRSIFPLVRQPGSGVTDGRQGPRSESVVLQQSEHHCIQSKTRSR